MAIRHKRWLIAYLLIGVAWLITKALTSRDKPLSPLAIIEGLSNPDVPPWGQVMLLFMGIVFPIVWWPVDIAMGLSVMPPHDSH